MTKKGHGLKTLVEKKSSVIDKNWSVQFVNGWPI
jgi:hypothetical protein